MKITAKCPGSCGEFIQGFIKGREMLVSCPVDRFSTVCLEEGRPVKLKEKVKKAALRTIEYFGEDSSILSSIKISICSEIPEAKGMASSTADIAGVIGVIGRYLGGNISEEEIARIAVSVEPTDSVVFKQISLFDHLEGSYIERLGYVDGMKVLVLENDITVDTLEYRKTAKGASFSIDDIYLYFKKGLRDGNYKMVGQACTESALRNNRILEKKYLDRIIEIAEKSNCYGVNVAHSGSVVGILFSEKLCDISKVVHKLKSDIIKEHYSRIYRCDVIKGGVWVWEE